MRKLIYTGPYGGQITIGPPPYLLDSFDPGNPQVQFATSKAPGQDGVTVEDAPLDPRPIQITVYVCASSPADLYAKSRALQSAFSAKQDGTLQYSNDAGTRVIPCRMQYIPTVKDPEGLSQQVLVQLYAPGPYWRDVAETVKYLSTWIGDLQFPISIPAEGIEFGHKAQSLIVNALNPGDAPCGMRVELTADATVVNPYLFNVYTGEKIRVKQTLSAGDKLIVNTELGAEAVTLAQGRAETSVWNWLDVPDAADFIQLDPGDNFLRYGADSGMDNLEMSIYYTPKYLGA